MMNEALDKCEVCMGILGGVLGNEQVIDGIIMCDYCSSLYSDKKSEIASMEPGTNLTTFLRKEWMKYMTARRDKTRLSCKEEQLNTTLHIKCEVCMAILEGVPTLHQMMNGIAMCDCCSNLWSDKKDEIGGMASGSILYEEWKKFMTSRRNRTNTP